MTVVDASVALKWFVEEEGSQAARGLFEGRSPLEAPELLIAEVCNAGWRLALSGALPWAQFDAMTKEVGGLIDRIWSLAPLARRAGAIARRLRHPVYDCFYLALAEGRGTQLITADRRLLERLAASEWRSLGLDLYGLSRGS